MSDNIKIVPLFEKKGGKIVRLPDGTSKRRNYRFFVGTNGMFNMEMDAVLSEEIDRMIAAVPHAGRSGLRKLAYYAVKDMKKDAKRGGPSGENWPELNEVTRLFPGKSSLRTQDRRKRRTGVKATFGKLTRAIAYYRYPAPAYKVEFGFLSRAAYRRGVLLQRGVRYPASQKMRRLFFKRGFIGPRDAIKIPARNLIGPSFRLHRRELIALFEQETRRVFQKRTKA